MPKLQVQSDAELMLQPLPEKTLTDAKDFRVVYDSNYEPAVFGLRHDGQLVLIAKDDRGNNTLVDLGKRFGLTDGEKIKGFGIRQDPKTLKIFFAFGSHTSSNAGKVYVATPFSPDKNEWYNLDRSILLTSAEPTKHIPHSFLLGTKADESGFPFLTVVTSDGDQKRKDLFRISVNLTEKSWTWAKDLEWAVHFDKMDDYCAASIPGASGIYGLETTQGNPRLTFVGLSGKGTGARSAVNVPLPLIDKPKCLATALDGDGFTNLFVGGQNGIFHLPAQEATVADEHPGTKRDPTLTHELLRGIAQLHVVQQKRGEDRELVIWALNDDGTVVYQPAEFKPNEKTDLDDVVATGPPVRLLSMLPPEAQRSTSTKPKAVIRFNALIHPKTGARQIYVLTDDGTVSWLQQAPASQIWSEEAFRIPDAEDVNDISTYTCHISIVDENKFPQANTKISVKTSSETRSSINGSVVNLSQDARQVKTDSNGVLTIILPASGLNVPNIILSADNLDPYLLNPASKAIEKLSTSAQNGSLKSAVNSKKQAIFPRVDDEAKKMLQNLNDQYKLKVANDKAAASGTAPTAPITHKRMVLARRGILDNIVHAGWEVIHFVGKGIEKIKGFVLDGANFLIDLGKKAWNFVVETAEHILEAVNTILNFIGDLVEDALAWLASKIDWTDVLDIRTILNELCNSGLAIGESLADAGEAIVDDFFGSLEKKIDSLHVPPAVTDEAAKQMSPDRSSNNKEDHSKNPCFNWGNYHIEHGGVKKAADDAAGDDANVVKGLMDAYNQFLGPIWASLKKSLDKIWEDLKAVFHDASKSFLDILKNLGADVLKMIVSAVHQAVKSMVKVFGQLFTWMRNFLNKPLNIWCITKLYKKITGGQQLTMLNLLSMLIAVPASWIFKLVTGKSPRDIPDLASYIGRINARGPDPPKAHSRVLARRADNASASNAESNDLIERLSNKLPESHSSRLKELYHKGFLAANTGLAVYSIFDTILTAVEWPTMKGVKAPGKWKRGFSFYVAIVMSGIAFPWAEIQPQSRRHGVGKQLRLWSWAICTGLNIFKSGATDQAKPVVAAIAGMTDFTLYLIAVGVEDNNEGNPQDSGMEIANRVMADVWALLSAYNAETGGSEPVGLAAAGIVGIAFNVQSVYIVKKQWDYVEKYNRKDPWDPPSLANVLNGSM